MVRKVTRRITIGHHFKHEQNPGRHSHRLQKDRAVLTKPEEGDPASRYQTVDGVGQNPATAAATDYAKKFSSQFELNPHPFIKLNIKSSMESSVSPRASGALPKGKSSAARSTSQVKPIDWPDSIIVMSPITGMQLTDE